MPDSTISNLSSLTGAGLAPNDIFALVDVSDTSMGAGGTNKKITRQELCTFNMGSISASTPLLDLAQTWNNAGGTFSAFRINITDTASTNGTLIDLQVAGVSKFNVSKTGAVAAAGGFNAATSDLYNARYVKFNGSSYLASATDGHLTLYNNAGTNLVNFVVESNHTLALRSSTNFQELRLYGSYTDGSNYDRLIFGPSGAAQFRISSDQAGTGTSRHLVFGTSNTDRFYINGSSGHLLAATDASYDIGAAGANRPRNLYLSSSAFIGGNLEVAGSQVLQIGFSAGGLGRIQFGASANGVLTIGDGITSGPIRVNYGGSTNAFPALKRSGQFLQVRLADDSAYTSMQMVALIFQSGSYIVEQGNGVIAMYNAAGTDFNRLQFGGTTSSFPAIKRAGSALQFRTADDSGFAGIGAAFLTISSQFVLNSPSDGVISLYNNAQNDFGRLQFGGTTSAFPALKRVTTTIQARLADDSGFAYLAGRVDASATTTVDSLGFRGVPQNIQNADYTFVAADSGKHIYHDEVTPRTYTIPANGSLAYDIGTTITIINNTGAGNILLTSADTIRRGDGVAGTGSRTIGPDSMVTLVKTKATEWMITGAFY